MSDFILITDSSADLGENMTHQLGVHTIPLSFSIGQDIFYNYPDNREMDPHTFYDLLRQGGLATTAAVNVAQYTDMLEPFLQGGQDVLILAFSSGLSTTYNSSRLAVEELLERFPERKIYTVDTLCASLGQGLLVYLAAQLRAQGRSIDEVRDWVEGHKLNLCHQFTVDDLQFLKRGGRISAATATVGSMLQIKPILHVDNEGHLIKIGKTRGRQAALKALVDRMEETIIHPESQSIFISHGDCVADAQQVAQMARDRLGVKDVYINYVGPVIGAHSGPGTLALFYVGKER